MIGFGKALYRIARYRAYTWLPDYLRRMRVRSTGVPVGSGRTHLLISMTDHFEPSRKAGEQGIADVGDWCEKYANLAGQYQDADGRVPQHSWFYRYDYPEFRCLNRLSRAVFDGFGEIEFHLHHGNSDETWFESTISAGKRWFQSAGAMVSHGENPLHRFAYIAGNWALDNGQGRDELSGVNNEIGVLSRQGCYADFTFPAFGERSQPPKANNIYMATAKPTPKSYWEGRDIAAGGELDGDLLIVQGPLYIDFRTGRMEYASIEDFTPYYPGRIDYWQKAHVHVGGRPEWTFVKLHTHGMQARNSILGDSHRQLLDDLQRLDPERYVVHYVTARETYNIIMAAAEGRSGDPNDYRDYIIPPPLNRKCYVSVPYRPIRLSDTTFEIELDTGTAGHVHMKAGPVRYLEFDAKVTRMKWTWNRGGLLSMSINDGGSVSCVKSEEGKQTLDLLRATANVSQSDATVLK